MVPKSEVVTLSSVHLIKLKAYSQKFKLVKIVLDLKNPKQFLDQINEAKCEGGMKLFKLPVGVGSSLIIGTWGDRENSVCFMSFHLLYIDLLMQITELSSV